MRSAAWKYRLPALLAMGLVGFAMTTPALSATGSTEPTASVTGEAPATGGSRAAAAMAAAAKANKYLFIFFWNSQDDHTGTLYGAFQTATKKMADRADALAIHTADAAEKAVVDKFGVSRAPMPLVLVIAPNGAVTRGFPSSFTENQLQQAFVSPGTAKCMKALQERKLVLLCVQNSTTEFNVAVIQGVLDFKADQQYAAATEVVYLNSADQAEATFLKGLQVDPQKAVPVTVFMAPPGTIVGKFEGSVTKDQLVTKLASAQSSCCPGGKCGPGGCGPKR